MPQPSWGDISFVCLLNKYTALQSKVLKELQCLSKTMCVAQPGKFLLMQFYMSQVTQVGESISNLIAQVNSMINNSVRNQKST